MVSRAIVLGVVACVALAPNVALAGDVFRVRLAWKDLEPMVRGHEVSVRTRDGASVKGRALAVEGESLVVDVRKTSNPAAHPKGRAAIPGGAIQELRMTRYIGNGRRAGKTIGGGAGLLAGVVAAVAIGFKEDPDTAGSRKVLIGLLIPASLIGGLLGGYLLGRAADREVTIIELIPDRAQR